MAAAAAEVTPDDVLTLIYTSGTTGHPKGVQLTHHAVMFTVRQIAQIIDFPPGSRVISWLPSAHIAERNAHHYIPVVFAGTITCAPEPAQVAVLPAPGAAQLVLRRAPHLGEAQGGPGGDAGRPARGAGALRCARRWRPRSQRVRLRQRGEPVPDELEAQVAAGRREPVLQAARDARPRPGAGGQRRRRPDPGRRARVLPRDRDRAGGAVGHVRDLRHRRGQPARRGQDRHGRPGRRPGSSSSSRRTARSCAAGSS